jgi:hypothetical protein
MIFPILAAEKSNVLSPITYHLTGGHLMRKRRLFQTILLSLCIFLQCCGDSSNPQGNLSGEQKIPLASKIPYVTTLAFEGYKEKLPEELHERGITQMNVGMLFLGKKDGKAECSFDNIADGLGNSEFPGQVNPFTRYDPDTIKILKMYNDGGGHIGLTFGGCIYKKHKEDLADPMDPGVCKGDEFAKLLRDTVDYLGREGIKVSWIDLDLESDSWRDGEYGESHYKLIEDGLRGLKDIGITSTITVPQYVKDGYWAKGHNEHFRKFLRGVLGDGTSAYVTFMLGSFGKKLVKGIGDVHLKTSLEFVNQGEIGEKVPYSKVVGLYVWLRNKEEGFYGDEAGLVELEKSVKKIHDRGFGGVMFWGLGREGKLDEQIYKEWKLVNEFDWSHQGDVPGPGPDPDPETCPSFVVEEGDTCWSLADSYCSCGNSYLSVLFSEDSCSLNITNDFCVELPVGETLHYDCAKCEP